jgi:hypothetical protein
MSDADPIPSLAEALTQIRRLQAENLELRARVEELEAAAAMERGTMQQQLMLDDEQARYAHNVPPNAPPHNEPKKS